MAAKILLINESTEECANIQEILTDFDVLVAKNAVGAIDKLKTHEKIKLVLLDLALPNQDAFRIIA